MNGQQQHLRAQVVDPLGPHGIALRLIALRQEHLAAAEREQRHTLARAFREDLALWVPWFVAHPDDAHLLAFVNLLVTEIATERNRQGLPAPEVSTPALWAAPDVDVYTNGPAPAPAGAVALVDRLGAMLAGFPGWTITVDLDDGGTVTARPHRKGAA